MAMVMAIAGAPLWLLTGSAADSDMLQKMLTPGLSSCFSKHHCPQEMVVHAVLVLQNVLVGAQMGPTEDLDPAMLDSAFPRCCWHIPHPLP